MRTLCRAAVAGSLIVLLAAPSWAQTDADKATARTLAQEGVALKQSGKYEEALNKLTRAQQIFDAPTHLLLIAQCQVALGRLVEGAETYRRLVRRKLDAGAPAPFRQAKKQGAAELAEVEPRIPKVRIKILPEGVHGFEVRIDDVKVPPAVVGVDRLTNPGHHVVDVTAPGYKSAQVQLQLSEGQVLPVEVNLERDGTPLAPPPVTPPPAGQAGGQPQPVPKPPPDNVNEKDEGSQLLLSLRLKTAFPGGDFGTMELDRGGTTEELDGGKVSDSFGPGGGLELQGGWRFSPNWSIGLFFGVDAFGQVSSDDYGADLDVLYQTGEDFEAKESAAPYAGINGQWFSSPDDLGVAAEVGLMVRGFTQTVEYRPDVGATNTCTVQVSRTTPMVRLLVGFQVPVGDDTTLTPFTSYAGGGVGSMHIKPDGDGAGCASESIDLQSKKSDDATVYLLTVGVSGTMAFGL